MSAENEWIVIVPPLPRDEAKSKFDQWKADQERQGRLILPEHVRIDQVFVGQGCRVRYLAKIVR